MKKVLRRYTDGQRLNHWFFAIMFFAAMFSGLLALMWMFRIVKQGRLWAFGICTGALGILVLLDQMIFHLIF